MAHAIRVLRYIVHKIVNNQMHAYLDHKSAGASFMVQDFGMRTVRAGWRYIKEDTLRR